MDPEAVVIQRDLEELNEAFLGLLAGGVELGLPVALGARLATLERPRRQRIAALRFALFSFRLEDVHAWPALVAPGVHDRAGPPVPAEVAWFALLALSLLRGLARAAPRQVAAWAGLPPQHSTGLAALQVAELAGLAPAAAARLRVRLAHDHGWWRRVIEACEQDDLRRLSVLGSFGMQWTIRRALGLGHARPAVRAYRR